MAHEIKSWLFKIDRLYRDGKLSEALTLAKALAEKHPRLPVVHFMLGNILSAQGRPMEAVGKFDKALRLKPDFAEAYSNSANALNAAGNFDTAIAKCRKALQIKPDLVETHNILGNALAALGRHDEAITAFRKALEIRADYVPAHNGLGNVLIALNRNEEALASYTKGLRYNPNFAPAHNGLANALNVLGRHGDAVANCNAALRIKPDFAEAHNTLANACLGLKQYEEASACYRRSLDLKPGDPRTHNNLAIALNALGRHEEAIASCGRALEIAPSLAESRRIMGMAWLSLEDAAMAAREFEAALKLKPEYPEALVGLATALEKQSMIAEAREAAERAVAMAPGNAEARRLLAELLNLQGHGEESRANIKTALEIDPANISAHQVQGEMLLAAGELREARVEFERILELDPNDLIARYSLSRLGSVREGDSNMLALIEAARHAASLPAPQAIAMHFALGKCFDDIGQYDEAFTQFEAGARVKRRRLAYNAGKTEQYVEGIRRFFTAATIERLTGHGFAANVPIFIVGMSRSGKTLTESILASHPSVASGGELMALREIPNPRGEAAAKYPLNLEGMAPAALAAMGERYARALMSRSPGALRITDTMPRNFYSVGLIHLMLPNAKIIHIRRDPLDTCLLNFMRLYDRGHSHSYDLTELGRYYRSYAALMDHWRSVLPEGSFHEIRYENLVSEPEKEIRALIDYCGLERQEACLQAGQFLHRGSVGKWRHYEKHLGPLIEALGNLAEGV
jgi:tetratricopeptide (TPR) repeat protein